MPPPPGDSTFAGPHSARLVGELASAADESPTNRRPQTRRPRRPIGSAVMHAPQVLRALVRADEVWLVVLAAFLGCATGIAVWLMTETTQLIHETLFGISPYQRLSAMASLNPLRTVLVPAILARSDTSQLEAAAQARWTLAGQAIHAIAEGWTTPQEIERVLGPR